MKSGPKRYTVVRSAGNGLQRGRNVTAYGHEVVEKAGVPVLELYDEHGDVSFFCPWEDVVDVKVEEAERRAPVDPTAQPPSEHCTGTLTREQQDTDDELDT